MLLVCRFRVSDPETFTSRVEQALKLLTAQPGCERGTLARVSYLTNQPRTFGFKARVNF